MGTAEALRASLRVRLEQELSCTTPTKPSRTEGRVLAPPLPRGITTQLPPEVEGGKVTMPPLPTTPPPLAAVKLVPTGMEPAGSLAAPKPGVHTL